MPGTAIRDRGEKTWERGRPPPFCRLLLARTPLVPALIRFFKTHLPHLFPHDRPFHHSLLAETMPSGQIPHQITLSFTELHPDQMDGLIERAVFVGCRIPDDSIQADD